MQESPLFPAEKGAKPGALRPVLIQGLDLVPIQPEYYALEGLSQLVHVLDNYVQRCQQTS